MYEIIYIPVVHCIFYRYDKGHTAVHESGITGNNSDTGNRCVQAPTVLCSVVKFAPCDVVAEIYSNRDIVLVVLQSLI